MYVDLDFRCSHIDLRTFLPDTSKKLEKKNELLLQHLSTTWENVPWIRAPKEDSNQPVRPYSLIRVLVIRRIFASLATKNAPSEDSNKTARMRRLIWIFAGRYDRRYLFWRCGSLVFHNKEIPGDTCWELSLLWCVTGPVLVIKMHGSETLCRHAEDHYLGSICKNSFAGCDGAKSPITQ